MTEQKTILVIEDEEHILNVFVKALTRRGFKVIFSDDGDKGLEMALRGEADLILLDLMLPGTTGEEILEAIRNDAKVKDTPVIVLTNKSDGASLYKCKHELGAKDYLIKVNTDFNLIVEKINKYLN